MKYIKQLDSIRAIAVILVIINHWFSCDNILNKYTHCGLGSVGVDIFFVLSGFLITKILLDNRNNLPFKSIKNFYFRRTLRIFPIYYLTIFILLIFHKSTGTNIKESFLYFLTYTSNFYFFKIQTWDGMLSHLWSLAVEEQFYLLWPWIILFINKKYLLHVIISFILIGILSQFFLSDIKMSNILTFSCFDSFGLGALLSWQITYNRIPKFFKGLSIVAILILLLSPFNLVPLRTGVSVISLWVISYIVFYQENLKLKFILNNRVLIYMGKISYGLYLYHNIFPELISTRIIDKYIHIPQNYHWVENSIILIGMSWLSYTLIEKRFLNLKNKYPMNSSKAPPRVNTGIFIFKT